MSGETPEGSPFGCLPETSRKFPMLIAARRTPVGANSETICCEACTGIGGPFAKVRVAHPKQASVGASTNPSPPSRAEREEPVAERWEGKVDVGGRPGPPPHPDPSVAWGYCTQPAGR